MTKEKLPEQKEMPLTPQQRLLRAKKHCSTIQKRGKNDFHNYSYTLESDIVSLVNEACEDNQLLWNCTYGDLRLESLVNDKGKNQFRTTLTCELTVIDVVTGSVISRVSAYGDSLDTGDKAIYKAQTGAKKYALMAQFGIASYDDPEHDAPLANPEVNARIKGEKFTAHYLVPATKLSSLVKLLPYLKENYSKQLKFNDVGDASLVLDSLDKKLEAYLIKKDEK